MTMKKPALWLTLTILLAAALRLYAAIGRPASGDESVSVIQAAGKVREFTELHEDARARPIPAARILWLVEASGDNGPASVIDTMKNWGMHPPAYYVLLHATVRILGRDILLLRCLSILFSLGSVALIYLIGLRLKDRTLGLMAAILLAVSTYGVQFSLLIRPYPVALFLALLSALLILLWLSRDRIEIWSPHFWGLVAASVAGIYVIYHFVFHLAFLWILLAIVVIRRRRGREWIVLFAYPLLVAAAYLPWIPGLLEQMQKVSRGGLYFHGDPTPLHAVGQLLTINFTKYLPLPYASIVALPFLAVLVFRGLRLICRHPLGLPMIVSLGLSFSVIVALDYLMHTNTACILKIMFFPAVMTLLVLAAGCHLSNGPSSRRQWLLVPVVLAAFGHSLVTHPNTAIDGPYSAASLSEIDRATASRSRNLAVVDLPRERHVLPIVCAMPGRHDFVLGVDGTFPETLAAIGNLTAWDTVTLISCNRRSGDALRFELERGREYLELRGYRTGLRTNDSRERDAIVIVLERSSIEE